MQTLMWSGSLCRPFPPALPAVAGRFKGDAAEVAEAAGRLRGLAFGSFLGFAFGSAETVSGDFALGVGFRKAEGRFGVFIFSSSLKASTDSKGGMAKLLNEAKAG